MSGQEPAFRGVHDRHAARPNAALLAQQYGGRHGGGWVSRLPAPWVPFVQLARLSPPVGLTLIYLPHLLGALLAAIRQQAPPAALVRACAVLLPGSFFFSNAAHAWNDLVDAPVDKLVARTRTRPIPRGDVSRRAALLFVVSQAVGAAAVLRLLPAGAARYALPNIVGSAYYPWAKRHTYLAQFVLGFCLSWGLVMGCVAMGLEPFAAPPLFHLAAPHHHPMHSFHIDPSAMGLLVSYVLWTAIFDTVYAHQDAKDDARLGLKSMALLFGHRTKLALALLLCCMVASLAVTGAMASMAWPYFILAPTGCALSLGAMIAHVELRDSSSCWWWFRHGFWLPASSIVAGLTIEYVYALGHGFQ